MKTHQDTKHRPAVPQTGADPAQDLRIPLLQESLEVSKRVVDTGHGVRVRKTVTARTEALDIALLADELSVEHVPMDILITDATLPVARYEGATLVVPVLEEVVHIEKQWRLKEEVRITRHQHQRQEQHTVVLRSETASIERFEDPSAAGRPTSHQGE